MKPTTMTMTLMSILLDHLSDGWMMVLDHAGVNAVGMRKMRRCGRCEEVEDAETWQRRRYKIEDTRWKCGVEDG